MAGMGGGGAQQQTESFRPLATLAEAASIFIYVYIYIRFSKHLYSHGLSHVLVCIDCVHVSSELCCWLCRKIVVRTGPKGLIYCDQDRVYAAKLMVN